MSTMLKPISYWLKMNGKELYPDRYLIHLKELVESSIKAYKLYLEGKNEWMIGVLDYNLVTNALRKLEDSGCVSSDEIKKYYIDPIGTYIPKIEIKL